MADDQGARPDPEIPLPSASSAAGRSCIRSLRSQRLPAAPPIRPALSTVPPSAAPSLPLPCPRTATLSRGGRGPSSGPCLRQRAANCDVRCRLPQRGDASPHRKSPVGRTDSPRRSRGRIAEKNGGDARSLSASIGSARRRGISARCLPSRGFGVGAPPDCGSVRQQGN